LTEQEKSTLSKTHTTNVEAYKSYLKGRYYWDKRIAKHDLDSAEKYFKSAIVLDPEYALAYAGLADEYLFSPFVRGLKPLEGITVAKAYLNKALSLDSTLSEALTTAGFIQSLFEYDWAQSKITLEKAIAANPKNPIAHLYYGNLLQYTGESTGRGIDELKKALALDPLSLRVNWVLGRNYYFSRQYDLAYEQLGHTLRLDSNYNYAKGTLGFVLLAQKKYPEAIQYIRNLPLPPMGIFPEPDRGLELSYAYAASGDLKRAREELSRVLAEDRQPSHYQLARVYAILNDPNQAISELEQAYKAREALMYFTKIDQSLEPLKNNLRFKSLLNKMNLN
jgi:tetratricopeptide (TPR) repeat protein